jgi:hypothetical protein
MALGDVAPARIERTEHRGGSTTGRPASLELVGKRSVHGLPHKRSHAQVPARGLTSQPRMLGVGQPDRDATHRRTVPHRLTLISVLGRQCSIRSVPVLDNLALTRRLLDAVYIPPPAGEVVRLLGFREGKAVQEIASALDIERLVNKAY